MAALTRVGPDPVALTPAHWQQGLQGIRARHWALQSPPMPAQWQQGMQSKQRYGACAFGTGLECLRDCCAVVGCCRATAKGVMCQKIGSALHRGRGIGLPLGRMPVSLCMHPCVCAS